MKIRWEEKRFDGFRRRNVQRAGRFGPMVRLNIRDTITYLLLIYRKAMPGINFPRKSNAESR